MLKRTTVTRFSAVILFAASALALSVHSGRAQSEVREIEITVENGRYTPARVVVTEGEKVRLKFLRKEHNACTKDVVFASLSIRRELPPVQPVYVDLPALEPGEVGFQCGMNMVKGVVLVEARK